MKLPRRLLIICMLALCGCGLSAPEGRLPVASEEADLRWQAFADSSSENASPSRLEGSLRFGTVNDTRRVTYILWSNGEPPLRMDIMAGVGALAAAMGVGESSVLVYLPQDEKAFIGTDEPDKAMASLGVPLPINLAELNAFLQGRYLEALGRPLLVKAANPAPGGNIEYTVQSKRGVSLLHISSKGQLVRWLIPGHWTVDISYDEASQLPGRIDGVLAADPAAGRAEEYRLVLLVRARQAVEEFRTADLDLAIPDGTPVYCLDSL